MFLCSLELNLLHNFSFSQMFLRRRAGKTNSPGAAGRGRAAGLSRAPGAGGRPRSNPGEPLPSPLRSTGWRLGDIYREQVPIVPPSRLRGSSVG